MTKSGGTSALFYTFTRLTMQQFTEKEVRESYGQALRMEPQCSSTIWYKRSFSLMIVYKKLKYDHFQRQFFPLTSANAVLQSLHESRKIRRFSRFLHKKDPADDMHLQKLGRLLEVHNFMAKKGNKQKKYSAEFKMSVIMICAKTIWATGKRLATMGL